MRKNSQIEEKNIVFDRLKQKYQKNLRKHLGITIDNATKKKKTKS